MFGAARDNGSMTAPQEPAEHVRGADLLWDTSTLRKGLQRQFFASLLEMTGSQIEIVEQTATELAPLANPRAPGEGLQRLYAAYECPETVLHQLVYREDPRTNIQHQIWWTEELARADGIYRTVLLNDQGNARYDQLMDSFLAADVLPAHTPDEVRSHPDAIIICQAAAINGKVMVSPDNDFHANRVAANAWAATEHHAGRLAQPMIVTRPERELEDWCAAEPMTVLKALIASAWPGNPTAARPHVEERLNDVLHAMARVEYLRPTAAFCRRLYTGHPEPSRLIEDIREHLPVRTRAADSRHPANPANRSRNWSIPDDSVRHVVELPRWRITVSERSFQILENQVGREYRIVEELPVRDRTAIARTLIERNIEVHGTPEHGGSHSSAEGFTTAINGMIDAELAKLRQRSR